MKIPNLKEEKKLWEKGYKYVIGIDEAGRGSLCGPVVAAAVMVKKFPISNFQFSNIQDSKKLTPKKRKELYQFITKCPFIEWEIGKVSEKMIDRINILEATKLAMTKAINQLISNCQFSISKTFLILDGKMKLDLPIAQKSIVKADEKVFSCAIASIVAKVSRDRLMEKFSKKFPQYGFDKHKGYPTKEHLQKLKKYGPSKIHRKSFKGVLN